MRVKAIIPDFNSPLLNEINDPSANIAIAIDLDSYRILKSVFGNVPRSIDNELFTTVKGLCVWQNNHAYWLMENTMRKIVPSGIPQHIRNTIFDFRLKFAQPPVTKGPQVFLIEDLKFGFIIWLITISIAVACFIIEITWIYGKIGVKNAVGLYVFLKMLQRVNINF